MKEQLFVYGTLKKPDTQKEVIGRIAKGLPDTLEGYKKSKIKIDDVLYPIIVPDLNSSIEGLVLSITEEELKTIDEYETDAYKRKKVILKSGKSAWAYVKNN